MGFRFDPPIAVDSSLRFDTKLECIVTGVHDDAGESRGIVHVVNDKLGADEETVVEASRWRVCEVVAVARVFREETEIGIVFGDLEEGIFETTSDYTDGTAMTFPDDVFKFLEPPFINVSQVNAALGD